ncbi:uroporphyrinogen-III synthase [Nitrospirillum sp. BR 11163]|uniref:uroporphyrinogen-III synthase n=1 Tax=Nitrospirillum sp. BR 11163 TaxID=3104323 RepID=UPI002AFE321D|nr:uroporphyrinogen-III synthase [Nitrospirillum sp. BR 11163]MEA1675389.1 uroporphyrinogen-III synthase [Nitrospirillum sp. BR 11163]
MATVLITRPRLEADRTAAAVAALGHDVLIDPLLTVEDMDVPLPPQVQAVLITSVNGVRALARLGAPRTWPMYVVGDRTAAAARELGFMTVRSAAGDANDLVRLVAAEARPDGGLLLHAAGADVAGDPAGALAIQGFATRRLVLYRAVAADALLPAIRDALAAGTVDHVLLFSPRSARTFVNLAVQGRADLSAVSALCLSPAVAGALGESGSLFRLVAVAAHPSQAALLDLLALAPGV